MRSGRPPEGALRQGGARAQGTALFPDEAAGPARLGASRPAGSCSHGAHHARAPAPGRRARNEAARAANRAPAARRRRGAGAPVHGQHRSHAGGDRDRRRRFPVPLCVVPAGARGQDRLRGARRSRVAPGRDRRPLARVRARRGAHDPRPRRALPAGPGCAPARSGRRRKAFFPEPAPRPARMGTLNLEGVSFHYPGRGETVLDKVTFVIPAGGIFGLLGPNGAGKTTLISILAGQLRGATGSIRAGVEPLEVLRRRRPHSLGLVPQEYAFYPMLTCAENLRFFGAVQGLAGARLKERIAAALARRAGHLSGGLKRRLNLAIGLLGEPEILLLDEPTVGVDPQSRAFLLESIRSLAGADRTIVYTSHYMEEIEAICDRVAIIDHGRVLVSGALSDVIRDGSDLEELFMQLTHRSLRD